MNMSANTLNPDTLVVVCGYAGDKSQIEMLMPHYVHHECSVVVMSPEDAPITDSAQKGVVFRQGGLKGWIGQQTLDRQRIHMKMMLEYPHKFFLMNDADSVCLSNRIPRYLYEYPDIFWSNEVTDLNPGPSFLPKIAMQPPYFTGRATLEKMVNAKAADSYYGDFGPLPEQKLPIPTGCIDHLMLCLAHGAGVTHSNFRDGCSFETGSDHGLITMAGLVQSHGKIFCHSVKTLDRLHRLVVARGRSKYRP